eukprot:TRINITY_DN7522_c0_g1_i6.p1 TRINITY_DN7522_c0_g1~~TRINITY_DN7522_c0_g1_i6.p1  ORF type:complete len:260 (+),score=54.76 TRINITY_DN7522_c0_g1_i6:961-1740(+)
MSKIINHSEDLSGLSRFVSCTITNLFGGFWLISFVMDSLYFLLASSVVIWYFRASTGGLYHLGTIAFGAFIIGLVRFARVMLGYLHAKLKAEGAENSELAKFVLRGCSVCLACFERFIRFVNHHAYIHCALTSEGFISSAREGFFLTMRNPLRFSLIGGLGELFIFLGKLFICLVPSLVGALLLYKSDWYKTQVENPVFPIVAIALECYVIGAIFMTVWATANEAIMHCFCVDEEIHKDKGGPKHCPERLANFVKREKA